MRSLIMLEKALEGEEPDPYQLLQMQDWPRRIFDVVYCTQELERALEAVRRAAREQQDPVVVIIGPTFLDTFTKGKKVLYSLFVDAGVPAERLIGMHCSVPGLAMMYESQEKFIEEELHDILFKAAEFKPVR